MSIEIINIFRIDNQESGPFERALVVAEEGSYVSYLATHSSLCLLCSVCSR